MNISESIDDYLDKMSNLNMTYNITELTNINNLILDGDIESLNKLYPL